MGKAELKMLNSIPREDELNHQFSKRFQRKMNKLIIYEKKSPLHRTIIYYGKKVAVIFLILFSITFASTMSIKANRVRFFEFVTEIWEEFTSFIFKSEENDNYDILRSISPSYIPDDFTILFEEVSDYAMRVVYINNDNNNDKKQILYEHRLLSDVIKIIDTEGVEVEEFMIGSQIVSSFINKGVNQIHWNDGSYYYSLVSTIDMDELIKMAESIIIK